MIKYYFKEAILPDSLVVAKDLMSRPIAELRTLAAERGIELHAKATKAEIVKALSESDKQGAITGSLILFKGKEEFTWH